MPKNRFLNFLILALTFQLGSICSLHAQAFSGTTNGLNYSSDGKTVAITGNTGVSGYVTIPGVINRTSVTSIGEQAFYSCSGLTSITIPNSVTSIALQAFANCTGLTNITIPNSVTSIGGFAFANCTGLTKITIPNSVTSIGDRAFYYCNGLTNISIPNSVTSIGSQAFDATPFIKLASNGLGYVEGTSSIFIVQFDKSTSAVEIPAKINSKPVTVIASDAFNSCSGLTNITIPNSVTSIGSQAFSYCSGLRSISIPNSVTSIGDNAFLNCTGLTNITIPNSVTSIALQAFANCTGLTNITIPNSVTSIGDNAFYSCSGLRSISIPNSVTSIGGQAFDSCSGLRSISIPNSVTSIGYGSFANCPGLTNVTIPNSVTSIGGSAFANCPGLTNVTIPNSVTSIGDNAFSGCSGLTSITIPNSVTSIGYQAFQDCTGLKSISIPDSVLSVGSMAFGNTPNLVNFQASDDLKLFIAQSASALGLSPQAINNFGSQTQDQIVALVRTALLKDQGFGNGILNLSLGNVLGTNPAVASLATNPFFVTALTRQILSGSNNYGIAVKQPQSLSFAAIPPITITPGMKYTNAVTANTSLPVTQIVGNTAVATVSNNVLTILGAGSTTVTASQAGNALYNPVSASQPLIVTKGGQTITFPAIPTVSFSNTAIVTLAATSSASLPITFVVGNTGIATIRTSNSITIIGTGTTTVTATNAGNSYFNPSGATQTLIVK